MTDKRIYQIGLTMITGVGDVLARHLLETIGDAEAVFTEKPRILEKVPGIGRKHIAEIKRPQALLLAEEELAFVEKNQIDLYFLGDKEYPFRLRECPDAPIVFYLKGKADLNVGRVLSIVGTRRSTHNGKEWTEKLIEDLAIACPDLLVVSGLAYGIDINAHREALKNQLSTIAVLAHGLDRIYPSAHRNTAIEMIERGGLLTDYPHGTLPDKPHFVKRNRIVAGLADATVVVESAEKGGSLITADIAFSYGRDVLAFPGRASDIQSKGCNALIRQNKAALITSADDLMSLLCWENTQMDPMTMKENYAIPFLENAAYEKIWTILYEQKEIHINQLALEADMPVYQLSALLLEMEMNNLIKPLPGGLYKALVR